MSGIVTFHALVQELLGHIGLDIGTPPSDQDLFSLSVDESYTLHLGLMNQDNWFMLAELNDQVNPYAPLADWLRNNRLNDQALQPVIGLNDEEHPCCWLRLPLEGYQLPELMAALDATLALADSLCGKGA